LVLFSTDWAIALLRCLWCCWACPIAFPCRRPFRSSARLAQKDVKAATAKAIPLLLCLERISQPRLQWLGHERAMIAIGALIMALAFGLLTAAPFIGQIPWGLAVCLLGLGLIERDGLLVLAAIALGAIGAVLSASFIYALFVTLTTLF